VYAYCDRKKKTWARENTMLEEDKEEVFSEILTGKKISKEAKT
jgi:hypothetical protein